MNYSKGKWNQEALPKRQCEVTKARFRTKQVTKKWNTSELMIAKRGSHWVIRVLLLGVSRNWRSERQREGQGGQMEKDGVCSSPDKGREGMNGQ